MIFSSESKNIYGRLVRFVAPYKWILAISMIASLGVSASDVAVAYLTKPFVDELIVEGNTTLMKLLPLGVICLMVFKGLVRYFQEFYLRDAGQLAIQDMRNQCFEHAMMLPMRYFSRQSSGSLMSCLLNDINVVQAALSENIVTLLREGLTMIGLIGYAFYTDWKMAFMTFVVIPAAIGPAAAIGRKIKKYSKRGQYAMGELTGTLQESIAGVKVVKAFGNENFEVDKFRAENFSFYRLIRKTFRYSSASSPFMEMVTSFGIAAALWYGFDRILTGGMTQGDLYSILAATLLMYGPFKKLIRVNNGIQQALGAAERIFELLDAPIDIKDRPDAVELPRSEGNVIFSNVTFAYDREPVLKNFTVEAKPGQVIALVGASGAGKSTFIGLLNRFYEPQSGEIKIDGYDINSITQSSLHANLALVDQETFLFNDTITNNIRYGRPDASEEDVRKAAKMAYADDFIMDIPEGYETVIGDRGVRLSGGQRQRICIARAILRDAPILLLDEATSALDTESEAVVQSALVNLMKNRTTFVIAHRLSTIMHADKILVLEAGQIVESGTHQQLLNGNGAYRRLYDAQFSE